MAIVNLFDDVVEVNKLKFLDDRLYLIKDVSILMSKECVEFASYL